MSGRPLRFCLATTFYPPHNFGGDGITVRRLAVALAEAGHHVEVIHNTDAFNVLRTRDVRVSDTYDDHPAIVHHSLRTSSPLLSTLITQQTAGPGVHAARLRAIFRAGNFDVVHFHNTSLIGPRAIGYAHDAIKLYTMHEHWLVCPMHVLWRFDREPCPGRKCIRCTLHGKRPPQLWRYTGVLERSLRHVDAFIAISQFTRDKHIEFGMRATAPFVHIPNFIPHPDPAGAARPRPHERPYYIYVGRLERIKGAHVLVDAFARYTDADLLIAGAGHEAEELRARAAGSPHIRFLGPVPQPELQPLMQHAIAVLVPSVGFEVFPTTVLEANALGTPVIGHRLGPLPEMLDNRGGLTYATESELLAALTALRNDPMRRDALGARGRETYLAEWTPERHMGRYFDLIANLQSGRRLSA